MSNVVPTDTAPRTLATRTLTMQFAGVPVLRDVSLTLQPGEVHGLVGENGAGKSTLLKLLGGVYQPTRGHIEINGQRTIIPSPHAAIDFGIALIHQEPLIFPDLDVAENMFVGRQPTRRGARSVHWREMRRQAAAALESLGLRIDPRTRMRSLSIADQQMVQIAAATTQDAQVLLLDEPTASLTPHEARELFAIVRRLRGEGKTIAFIGHRFEEIFEICDRISVLRDGQMVGERDPKQTTPDEIISMMVGRSLDSIYEYGEARTPGEVVLEVEGLYYRKVFRDVTFSLRKGEIVGMAGLVGAGRSEVARAIFGITPPDQGTIRIDGNVLKVRSPRDAMDAGLAYVPEDRQQQGLFMPMTIAENASISALGAVSRAGWLSAKKEKAVAQEYVQRLRVVTRGVTQAVRELSGGNQQKVVIAKWLLTRPRVIILDEPTRGVDVGGKVEVHRLMRELAAQGTAILMISSDLPEVLGMSDRILVMRHGEVAGEFSRHEANAEAIMAAATGQVHETAV